MRIFELSYSEYKELREIGLIKFKRMPDGYDNIRKTMQIAVEDDELKKLDRVDAILSNKNLVL